VSCDQRFLGSFMFASPGALEAGLDAFTARLDDCVLDLQAFTFTGSDPVELRLDYECSASSSMYEATCLALAALGQYAATGEIQATLWLDGASRRGLKACGKTAVASHRRWEVFLAAWFSNAAKLAELAAAGITLDQRFAAYRGFTTLHVAASRRGGAAAVRALLAAGISPTATPGGESPVLAVAADDEICAVLMAAGADPSANDGQAFVHAVNRGRHETARVLLAAGVKLSGMRYASLLDGALRNDALERFEWLLGHPDMKAMLAEPGIIASALRNGGAEHLDLLVRHGATLPDTLLTDAIGEDASELVDVLLAGLVVERCGASNRRTDAMCVAAAHAHLGILEKLAGLGVPIHPVTPGETTPLHEAAASDGIWPVECVEFLVERGAPMTARDANGRTVLEAAKTARRPAAFEWLTAHGAAG
jgi:hypothetical protein